MNKGTKAEENEKTSNTYIKMDTRNFFSISKEKYIKMKEETPNQCPLGIQRVYKRVYKNGYQKFIYIVFP